VRIVDIEKEAIYETDVLVMGTDGLWDVTSNERVAEIVSRSLEQFPVEDEARYRYRFTSAAQDLVMSSRGKLSERSWRTSDEKAATIDDISVFVIPLSGYKEAYIQWKKEQEAADATSNAEEPSEDVSSLTVGDGTSSPSGYVSFAQSEQIATEEVLQSLNNLDDEKSADVAPPSVSADPSPVDSVLIPVSSENTEADNIPCNDDLNSST